MLIFLATCLGKRSMFSFSQQVCVLVPHLRVFDLQVCCRENHSYFEEHRIEYGLDIYIEVTYLAFPRHGYVLCAGFAVDGGLC